MGKEITIEARHAGRRRRYTSEQKRVLLNEAARPGGSISEVARRYGIAPSVMFLWRRTMDDASEQGLKANERVVPESEVKKLQARIRELERALGRKTMEVEILQEAVKLSGEKKTSLARRLFHQGRWPMKRLSDALGVSRSHLSESLQRAPRPRGPYHNTGDAELLCRIEVLVAARPSYGYRRITALLNRGKKAQERVNHKRVYRVMRDAGLLLPKYSGQVERPHEGQVITLKSDLRWFSDMLEIRCWDGDKVHVAFSLDCCDRECISWVAAPRHLDGSDVRDLMAQSVEARFGSTECPHRVEWLSDNGPPYTAHDTRSFGASCGLRVRNTPAYSPESNGMAEAFVKTFKRDYVYLADLWDAETVLGLLPTWFADYNHNHPHKGLKMMSPKEFRRSLAV